jgi:hypothetical protein
MQVQHYHEIIWLKKKEREKLGGFHRSLNISKSRSVFGSPHPMRRNSK